MTIIPMLSKYIPFLTITVLIVFLILLFFSKEEKNKLYIKYILLSYPLIGLNIYSGNLSINNFEIITVFFWVVFFKQEQKLFTKEVQINNILISIIILSGIMGVILSNSITLDTLKAFIELITILIYGKILIQECLKDHEFIHEVTRGIKISIIISLIFLVCQVFIGLDFTISKSLNGNIFQDDSIRYPSYFQDPQKYAQFLSVGSFLLLIENEKSKKMIFNYLLLSAIIVAILFTGGRAALGGWAIGFTIILLFANIDLKIFTSILIAIIGLIIYIYKDKFIIFNRGDNINDSYLFRVGIWKDAYKIFLAHPYFGIAPGNYSNYVSIHNQDQFWMADNQILYYDHPESGYLKILTEYGIIGFLSFFLIIIITITKGFKQFIKTKDLNAIILISSITCWLIGFYTIYSLGDVRIQILIVTIISLLIVNNKTLNIKQINKQ